MPDTALKTTEQLIAAARKNAEASKKLNASVTVASGAVTGGPASNPPPVTPPPAGSSTV